MARSLLVAATGFATTAYAAVAAPTRTLEECLATVEAVETVKNQCNTTDDVDQADRDDTGSRIVSAEAVETVKNQCNTTDDVAKLFKQLKADAKAVAILNALVAAVKEALKTGMEGPDHPSDEDITAACKEQLKKEGEAVGLEDAAKAVKAALHASAEVAKCVEATFAKLKEAVEEGKEDPWKGLTKPVEGDDAGQAQVKDACTANGNELEKTVEALHKAAQEEKKEADRKAEEAKKAAKKATDITALNGELAKLPEADEVKKALTVADIENADIESLGLADGANEEALKAALKVIMDKKVAAEKAAADCQAELKKLNDEAGDKKVADGGLFTELAQLVCDSADAKADAATLGRIQTAAKLEKEITDSTEEIVKKAVAAAEGEFAKLALEDQKKKLREEVRADLTQTDKEMPATLDALVKATEQKTNPAPSPPEEDPVSKWTPKQCDDQAKTLAEKPKLSNTDKELMTKIAKRLAVLENDDTLSEADQKLVKDAKAQLAEAEKKADQPAKPDDQPCEICGCSPWVFCLLLAVPIVIVLIIVVIGAFFYLSSDAEDGDEEEDELDEESEEMSQDEE